jgi:hypothetical protein
VIYEWKLDGETRNFGDALYEVLLPAKVRKEWEDDLVKLYFPIGSVICNEVIRESLDQGFEPIFYNCGWRGEELNPDLVAQCEFYGARGPHTQAALLRAGVSVDITGDPAYALPGSIPAGEPNGLALCIRHIMDPSDYTPNTIFEYKVDALFTPAVENKEDIVEVIEKISGARFVLAGSMHAAIVAHAYGVPFALMGGEYIDCPPKWADWFAQAGLGEPVWVENIVEGRGWYNEVTRKKGDKEVTQMGVPGFDEEEAEEIELEDDEADWYEDMPLFEDEDFEEKSKE